MSCLRLRPRLRGGHLFTNMGGTVSLLQVDFYFGDTNYPKDKYLQQCATADPEGKGWIPVSVVASFRKLKRMCTDMQFILESIPQATMVELDLKRQMVRRNVAVPKDLEDALCRTMVVEGLKETDDLDSLRIFGEKFGPVDLVRILQPRQPYPGKLCRSPPFVCSGDVVSWGPSVCGSANPLTPPSSPRRRRRQQVCRWKGQPVAL